MNLQKLLLSVEGRISRQTYWLFYIAMVVGTFFFLFIDRFIGTFDQETGFGLFSTIYSIAMIIPNLAIQI
jgi:uncharacterized membrane protein YhaH (DUF805 family)